MYDRAERETLQKWKFFLKIGFMQKVPTTVTKMIIEIVSTVWYYHLYDNDLPDWRKFLCFN